jgi:hypothetical protein
VDRRPEMNENSDRVSVPVIAIQIAALDGFGEMLG